MPKKSTLRDRARELRQNRTPAEKILWSILRGRRLIGFKFRRQQIVGAYIADFFCAEARLIVELDGETHVGKESKDQQRQSWLEKEGYKVLRFWNPDVYENKDTVTEVIWQECESRKARPLTPDPSPPRGEGRRPLED